MNPPGKPLSAEEVAAQCWCDPTVSDREMDVQLCTVFAKALTDFAKQYAEEMFQHRVSEEIPKYFMKGRNEALEQAAKIADELGLGRTDSRSPYEYTEDVGEKIRALKSTTGEAK